MPAPVAKRSNGRIGRPPRPGRSPLNVRILNSLIAAVDQYRLGIEFQPDRSAVVESAVRQFLREKGVEVK